MLRKICVLLLIGAVSASCGSRKAHIQTTKNKPKKTRTTHVSKTETASNNKKDDRQVEVLESTSKTTVYADLVKEYINTYKDIAKDNMRRHGIPASITLAQGILESGAGKGTLCVTANNHFGIKCHTDWTGDKVYHDDDSAQECFRKYAKPSESFEDHSQFLTTRGRYAALFKLDKDDYQGWAKGLRAAGYATDPKYPEKLTGLIERYDLAQYDAEVLSKKYEPKVKNEPAVVSAPKPAPTVASQAAKEEASVGANEYKVVKGDTMYSISKKHNLTVDQLMQLNGLTTNALSIGQVLKVK
ncbi:hemagglutinin [Flavobacterium akiainvivens]|uniref:Peptidoglycan hydrolase n=1 Tax=Flavobacterium akiainvivens TaxID=1202724 RepID=A0A0M8MK65_9FLAO|nr:glucosaminidase domain-containing protein [Flavobacterium akiainvivens]KOS07871.1 hemagglutinin [Flavobacterium akiainvivens]SFQ27877.1 Flagellum-specific peptidoglycan hydrolase FlgJ [Flavobacterium akiainvivens]